VSATYLVRRLVSAVVVIFGVLVITFIIARVIPNDPARLYAGGARATPAEVAQARAQLGLDQSLPLQFLTYVANISHGDFGVSLVSRRPVAADIRVFLPASLELVIPAMLLALIIGIPVGVLSAAFRGGIFDTFGRVLSISGASLPSFWLALMAQLIFGTLIQILPISGQNSDTILVFGPLHSVTGFNLIDAVLTGNWSAFTDTLTHMVLPVAVLATYPISLTVRMTRAAMLEVLSEPYVVAARASGVAERTVLFRLVLKNALGPTLTVLGLTFAAAFTGTVLIEIIFGWPGIGRYVTDAISDGDFPVIMAVTLVGTIAYIILNLLVDIIQAALDPRIRVGSRAS
jgi:peptide/nickel transport system permease protein